MKPVHTQSTPGARSHRITPTPLVGITVVIAYIVVVAGMQFSSGIDYRDWFASTDNVYRTAVVPLSVGSVLLVAFLAWVRWDSIWRDSVRLPMSVVLWVPPILFALAIVPRLIAVEWAVVGADLLVAVALTAVLVGFAEEVLFRGIFLRSMRTGGRPEAWCALWTAIAFGLFHVPNIFMGQGPSGIAQVVLATFSGFVLYLFRRGFGVIVVAMFFHGLWDFSVFLDEDFGRGILHDLTLPTIAIVVIATAIAAVVLVKRERTGAAAVAR